MSSLVASRAVPVVALCLCLLVAGVLPAVAAGGPATTHGTAASAALADGPVFQAGDGLPGPFQTGDVDADSVLLRADVRENGDATWTVEYRVRLDDNATAGFERLRADIAANETRFTQRFARRMGETVANAETATGREMSVENVTVSARNATFGDYGVVAYRFDWGGFAATGDGRIVAGDALAGLFLDERTRLVVAWPGSYTASEVRPTPEEQGATSVAWDGRQDFGDGEPRVVLTPGEPTGSSFPLPLPVVGVVGLLAIGALGAVWWTRRGDGGPLPVGSADDGGSGAAATDATDGDDAAAGAAAAGGAATDETTPPPELLSNEERVVHLLEQHGGRMKQQDVVSELGWTEAKTSQVVGSLRDEGKLESFRLGRENVLTLPDRDEE
jgi:hypothetical protein